MQINKYLIIKLSNSLYYIKNSNMKKSIQNIRNMQKNLFKTKYIL